MSKPREEVKEKEYYKSIHFLYEILGSLKNVEEVKLFIKDILTKAELRMLKRRWHIASLLYEGLDIRTVAIRTKTSTQTVSKIKNILENGNGGLGIVLQRARGKEKTEHRQYLESKTPARGSKFVKGWFS